MIADREVALKLIELFPNESIYNFPVSDNANIPDKAVFVNQYGEKSPDRTFSSREETQYPLVQIYVRGEINDNVSCRDLSNDIRKKLQSISWTATDGTEIQDCKISGGGIFPLGKDSKNRYQRSLNFQLFYNVDLNS
jgi:hypothetical protein